MTNNLSRAAAPGNVTLGIGEAGLPKPSVVNVSRLATVDKAELTERVGRLSASSLDAVLRGVHLVMTGG